MEMRSFSNCTSRRHDPGASYERLYAQGRQTPSKDAALSQGIADDKGSIEGWREREGQGTL